MAAILFGSISTIADTSELQREAFNAAFTEHGLDWHWDRESYQPLLQSSGGEDRVAEYAKQRGDDVDASAVHQTKSRIAQERLAAGVTARPGVADTIKGAKAAGDKVALVTTTARENLDALFAGLDDVDAADFDVITDRSSVDDAKPDPAAYTLALSELGEEHGVAIEDNVIGLASAKAAGLPTVAFPNENTGGHDFGAADERVDALAFDRVQALAVVR